MLHASQSKIGLPSLPAIARIASLWLLLTVCGCVHTPPQLTLAHDIRAPKEWRGGSDNPGFSDASDINRYTSGYDRGWAWCVVHHARDIEFQPACSDLFISGWAAETYGWPAGIRDAQTRIEQLVRAYGKQKVSDFLSDFKDIQLENE